MIVDTTRRPSGGLSEKTTMATQKSVAPTKAKAQVAPTKAKAPVAATVALNDEDKQNLLEEMKDKKVRRKAKPAAKAAPGPFALNAKITVLPDGKENPRRQGSGPFARYEDILKSKTVGDFLKRQPQWRATLKRAVDEGLIAIG
jgi:hypothetical protein